MTDERAPDLETWTTTGYRPPSTPSQGAPFGSDETAADLLWQNSASGTAQGRRRRRPPLGALSIGIALISLVGDVLAISLATTGEYVISTRIAQAVIVLSGVAILIGVVAAIRRRHRRWAIVGIILGLAVNPLVAVAVLGFFGSL